VPTQNRKPERYEPMPGIIDLPGWIWRRLPPVGKVGLVVALVALVAVAVAIAPGIRESKSERERAEQQQRQRAQAAREARIRREQRPRFVDGPPATSGVGARRRLLDEADRSVLEDARRRAAAGQLRGPIRRVDCEPFPRNVAGIGAEDSTELRFGRYACLAVTADFLETESTSGGLLGHPYRLRIDFDTGRYAFCKIAGRPAEGQLKRRLGVTVPAVCGGGP
jgi:type II secretory pathway pseudopilin PulG